MKKERSLTKNRILDILRERENDLRKYHVKRIGLFGSYVTGKQSPRSDVDFVVEFEQPSFDNYMDLTSYLERLLGKKIDILTPEGIRSIRVKEVAKKISRSVLYV